MDNLEADLAASRERIRDKDTAHAVALERERIAAWLETPALSDAVWNDPEFIGTDHALAAAIRSGAHNEGEKS